MKNYLAYTDSYQVEVTAFSRENALHLAIRNIINNVGVGANFFFAEEVEDGEDAEWAEYLAC